VRVAAVQDKRTVDFLIRKEDEKGGPRKQRIVVEDNIKKLHQMVRGLIGNRSEWTKCIRALTVAFLLCSGELL
jgi:hypothetical protein